MKEEFPNPAHDPAIKPGWQKEHEGMLSRSRQLKGRFCSAPFDEVQIFSGGEVGVCCPSWLPRPIGTMPEAGFMSVWNSGAARKIRESILDGSFKYCDHQLCPKIQSGTLPEYRQLPAAYRKIVDRRTTAMEHLPGFIGLDYDLSCNLSCPSCRTHKKIFARGSPQYEESRRLTGLVVKELLQGRRRKVVLNLIGSGDPFVSPAFRDFLKTFDGTRFPDLVIDLQTNGLLFTERMWGRLAKIQRNIRNVFVSVDAATPETYAVVRRGGDWRRLMENMEFLSKLRRGSRSLSVHFILVVQQRNFREMPLFADKFLGERCDYVRFSFLNDWDTWGSRAEYERQCVWKETHPEFQDLLRILQDPVFDDPRVKMGNVAGYRDIALRQAALRRAGAAGCGQDVSAGRPFRPTVELYLRTNDSGLFRFSFLLRPVFWRRRLGAIRSWEDLRWRAESFFRLLTDKLLRRR